VSAQAIPRTLWLDRLTQGLVYYYLTSAVAILGLVIGHEHLKVAVHAPSKTGDLVEAFANWDGRWYRQVTQEGYSYDGEKNSDVAFFPAFPLLGRFVEELTGLRAELALLAVAHLCLAATFVVLAGYVRCRAPDQPALVGYTLLAFGLVPTTFFFRMAYSESLFVLCSVLALYGMRRRWPLVAICAIIGVATATRPVGVALLAPLALYLWERSETWRGFVIRLVGFGALASWGLAAYMVYQYAQFGEALAFAKTQAHCAWGRWADSWRRRFRCTLCWAGCWRACRGRSRRRCWR
jgi:Gpi18-like mannosyltransferase